MKKLYLLLLLLALAHSVSAGQEFDRGYEAGFDHGWKQVRGEFALPPIAPLSPLPKIGCDTFLGGYDQGFLDGIRRAGG